MTSACDLKNHHISILYSWDKDIQYALFIHHETNNPVRTIYYNINQLKQTNSLKHRGGNDGPCVPRGTDKKAIGQYIRRNNEMK